MPGRRGRSDRAEDPSRESLEFVLAGRGLVRGRLEPIEVGVSDAGQIVRIGRNLRAPHRLDLGERVLLPAATDLHVHFRDPGAPSAAENISTGTIGAALGGVALVGDMPNTEPPVVDRDGWETKVARIRGRAAVDVLVYGMAHRSGAVRGLAGLVGGFKLYLGPTTGVSESPTEADLPEILGAVAETGLPLSVHAEDPSRFGAAEASGPPEWNSQHPPDAERSAVDVVLAAAPPALRLHLAHLTTTEAAGRVRAQGHSFEATPHHLLFSEGSFTDARGKVNPPLRSRSSQADLLAEFEAGRIPSLASDHAPHAWAAKERAFPLAPSGMPGTQTMLPLFLQRVRDGKLPLDRLVAAACDRPARWLGVRHGRIAPGHSAHLIAVDFRRRGTVEGSRLASPCGWSAFEGWPVIYPTHHFRFGKAIVEEGEYVGAHEGTVARPEYAPVEPRTRLGQVASRSA